MASAFQMQARVAQLQRTSELAGEAFGCGIDGEPVYEPAASSTLSLRWLGVLAGAGLFLLAVVFVTA